METPGVDTNRLDDYAEIYDERTPLLKPQSTRTPWYSCPSFYWLLPGLFVIALVMGAIAGSRVEIYTQLICRVIAPENFLLDPPLLDAPQTQQLFVSQTWASAASKLYQSTPKTDLCHKNPAVQATLSKLMTAFALTMGGISALMTPFWGGVSDRRGRKVTFLLGALGFTLMDIVCLSVIEMPDIFSYKFLFVGYALEGLCGGMSVISAGMAAYIADTSEAGSRSHIFSIVSGFLFGGLAVGPSLGSLVIKLTKNIIAPFYLALAVHLAYFFFVLFFMPESLSKERQYSARDTKSEEMRAKTEKRKLRKVRSNLEKWSWKKRVSSWSQRRAASATNWAKPMLLLMPRKRIGGRLSGWGLPLVAIASAFATMTMGSISVRMQYTQFKFNWGPIELGNFLTLMGITRIITLLVILPITVKIFKSPHVPHEKPKVSSDPTRSEIARIAEEAVWERKSRQARLLHDYKFDLFLSQISFLVDSVLFFAFCTHPSVAFFMVVLVGQSLCTGAGPALNSLGLSYAKPQDTGKLMAALSTLETLCSSMLAPVVYGLLYAGTVKKYPEAIFILSGAIFMIAFLALCFVQLNEHNFNEADDIEPEDQSQDSDITV